MKEYMAPEMEVVELKYSAALLVVSGEVDDSTGEGEIPVGGGL